MDLDFFVEKHRGLVPETFKSQACYRYKSAILRKITNHSRKAEVELSYTIVNAHEQQMVNACTSPLANIRRLPSHSNRVLKKRV